MSNIIISTRPYKNNKIKNKINNPISKCKFIL